MFTLYNMNVAENIKKKMTQEKTEISQPFNIQYDAKNHRYPCYSTIKQKEAKKPLFCLSSNGNVLHQKFNHNLNAVIFSSLIIICDL